MTPEQTAEFWRILAVRRRLAPHETPIEAKDRLLASLQDREWKTSPVPHWCAGLPSSCWACFRPEQAEQSRSWMDKNATTEPRSNT